MTNSGNVFIDGVEVSTADAITARPPPGGSLYAQVFATAPGVSLYNQVFGRAAAAAAPAEKESLHDALTTMRERDRTLDDDAEDRVQCIICCERQKCVALVPCGHVEVCVACALELVKGSELECPVCKEEVEKVAFARV